MRHSMTFIRLYKSLSGAMVSFAALSLALFGAANGLASQQLKALRVLRCQLSPEGNWPNLQSGKPVYYYYFTGTAPSYFEAFPFLQALRVQLSNSGQTIDYVPYGDASTFGMNIGGYVKYPFFYRQLGILNAGTIPDDWTQSDIDNINASYNALTDSQKQAIKGTVVAGNVVNGDSTEHFFQFNQNTPGTVAYDGGIYTYDEQGKIVVSFPDNTGYISGYTPNPDGTFTPTYYTIDNGNVVEVSSVTPTIYDTLDYDSDLGHYTLNLPNYTPQLNTIINKMDSLQSGTPEVTVNLDSPSFEADLTDIEQSLVNIGDLLYVSESNPVNVSTNDFTLDQDEQTALSYLRTWETNLPLLGEACDYGLNTLFGRIPNIGTEYLWLDYTIGGTRSRSSSASSNWLDGYRIRIDLTPYRDTLLAYRGWLIMFEALYFIILVYKAVREAAKV